MIKTRKSSHSTRLASTEVVCLPSAQFYVRRIALDAASDMASQVELALEAGAPFALEQLYHGFLPAPDGRSALIYASHRRIFPGEDWAGARVVLPDFVALLGESPGAGRLRLWSADSSLTVAVWDGSSSWPVLVLSRQCEVGNERAGRNELLTEVGRRLPGRKWELEEYVGPVELKSAPKGQGIEFQLKAASSGRTLVTTLEPAVLESADVRDKVVLATRRQSIRRDRLLWGAFSTVIAAILVSLVLEAGVLAAGVFLKKQRIAQEKVADEVSKIETAQTLSVRIEEMGQRQLRPLEMIAAVNNVRPASIQFIRCATSGLNTLEIEAQTNSATSVGTYETALRGLAVLESAEIRDVRLRDGMTTFQFTAVFKAGALATAESVATEVAP